MFKAFYGVMILSKYPCNFYELPFPSMMGRSLVVAEPIGGIDGHRTLIATAHFESMDSSKIRKLQMNAAFELMKGTDFILMGDFNFDDSSTKKRKRPNSAGAGSEPTV